MNRLAMILAATSNGEIGYKNTIPWRLKGDLPRFKSLTEGNVLIYGRSTHESLPAPLVGRICIVLSKDPAYVSNVHDPENDIYGASSLEEALTLARSFKKEFIFFAGGAKVYEDALKLVDTVFLTLVHKTAPKYDTKIKNFKFPTDEWEVGTREVVMERVPNNELLGQPSHSYQVLTRIRRQA